MPYTQNPLGKIGLDYYEVGGEGGGTASDDPTVTLTGGSTNEVGQTVTSVPLVWTCNKAMTSRELTWTNPVGNLTQGAGQDGSYTHSVSLTSNRTYTMTVTDSNAKTASSTTTVAFRYRRYWGTSTATSLTPTEVQALANELSTTRTKTWTQEGNDSYIYYAYPESWGDAIFYVNGFLNNAWIKSTASLTNAYGDTTTYFVYRSQYLQHGTGIQMSVV